MADAAAAVAAAAAAEDALRCLDREKGTCCDLMGRYASSWSVLLLIALINS